MNMVKKYVHHIAFFLRISYNISNQYLLIKTCGLDRWEVKNLKEKHFQPVDFKPAGADKGENRLNDQLAALIKNHLYLLNYLIYPLKDETVQGLGFDDLYQTGCEALCHAALYYDPERGAAFATFATAVVRNKLINEVRRLRHLQSPFVYLDAPISGTDGLTYADTLAVMDADSGKQAEIQGLRLLASARYDYTGITRKGIVALQLYYIGYSQTEVARRYGVDRNQITAWIARARSRLRKDARFTYLLAG